MHSQYLIAKLKNPATTIQNRAPGPPSATAVVTPMILPVPTVAPIITASEPKLLTMPSLSTFLTESFMAGQVYFCRKCSRTVK